MAIKYDDLFSIFAEGRETKGPKGQLKIKKEPSIPTYFLEPDDISAALNAFTPYDLYTNPDRTPGTMPYSTNALAIMPRGERLGFPESILFSTGESKRAPINELSGFDFTHLFPSARKYGVRGIYEHEKAHITDPRLRIPQGNKGFITKSGIPGEIAGAEEPAVLAEDEFWRGIFQELKNKKGRS